MAEAVANPLSTGEPFPLDKLATTLGLLLLLAGLIMVASASTEVSDRIYGSPFYLLMKHGAFVSLSLFTALVALMIPVQVWQRLD